MKKYVIEVYQMRAWVNHLIFDTLEEALEAKDASRKRGTNVLWRIHYKDPEVISTDEDMPSGTTRKPLPNTDWQFSEEDLEGLRLFIRDHTSGNVFWHTTTAGG